MRLTLPPAPSYYRASIPEGADRPRAPLAGAFEADVAIVGGGLAGCSAALHLAKRGFKVALLEANSVGYGASGRSGGQTIFGLAAGQSALASQVGREDARRLFDLSIEALDLNRALIEEHRIECDYRPNHVHVATKPRHLAELSEWFDELRGEYAYESVSLLDRHELQAHVRSARYLGGLLDTRSGHLHPLKFTLGIARAAESAGATIFERTEALRYEQTRDRVHLHAANGTVRCRHLILCANAYLGALAPQVSRRILGVGTYIIATEPLQAERAHSLLPSDAAIADINWILDYFRLSADRRLLFGGRVSYSAFQPPRLAESMRPTSGGCRRTCSIYRGSPDTACR
jgi:gamma-glutamylputrescine oxidase